MEILSAARALFSELEYDEISLNGIAREAGFSKPNVYRYFSTREEIFLAIFREEQDRFVESLIKRLKRIRSEEPVDSIARSWVKTALEHSVWLDLLPQLSLSMERNSSVPQLVEFKKVVFERLNDLVKTFHQVYPAIDIGGWSEIAQCGYSMMAGLWPHSNPGENVIEAMKHPEVDQPLWDFEKIMVSGLKSLILGMANRKS